LPNVYVGKLGISEADFDAQLIAATQIAAGTLSGGSLLPRRFGAELDLYPGAFDELSAILAGPYARMLSIGCASGDLERTLAGESCEIVGVPLDSIIGAVARSRGIRTTQPDIKFALAELEDEKFDVILMHNTLPRFDEPIDLLRAMRGMLRRSGVVCATAPNPTYTAIRTTIGRARAPFSTLQERTIRNAGKNRLCGWFAAAGYTVEQVRYRLPRQKESVRRFLQVGLGRFVGSHILIRASLGKSRVPKDDLRTHGHTLEG
jgi:2-polyprenyl-3-methyl-5-hydroxy-6-metoxy-1,4-benzoquinol methylase